MHSAEMGEAMKARRPSGRRPGLAALALANALAAFGGAVGLAAGALALESDLDQRLPFASPVFGGIALAVMVGLPLGAVAVLAWRGDDRADAAAVAVGVVLMGWIVVQLVFLRSFSFFHVFYVAMGALFVWLGRGATTGVAHVRNRRSPEKVVR